MGQCTHRSRHPTEETPSKRLHRPWVGPQLVQFFEQAFSRGARERMSRLTDVRGGGPEASSNAFDFIDLRPTSVSAHDTMVPLFGGLGAFLTAVPDPKPQSDPP